MRLKRNICLIACATTICAISGCAATQSAKAPAEPTVEYFKLDGGKLVPGKVKANAFFEIPEGEKIYVFISPKAKAEWAKTGKLGGKLSQG